MNCCDQFGNCRQGRDCPVRRQRVRAGGPPPTTLPEFDEYEETWRQYLGDLARVLLIAFLIAMIIAVSLGMFL